MRGAQIWRDVRIGIVRQPLLLKIASVHSCGHGAGEYFVFVNSSIGSR